MAEAGRRRGMGRPIGTAALRTALDQDMLPETRERWAKLIKVFQPRHDKLAKLMIRAEDDVPACKTFPQSHRRQIHSANPLERLNKEGKRRSNVTGIIPTRPATRRLVGALMLEQNDEWAVTRRCVTLETVAAIRDTAPMDPAKIAALKTGPKPSRRTIHITSRGTIFASRQDCPSLASFLSASGTPAAAEGPRPADSEPSASPRVPNSPHAYLIRVRPSWSELQATRNPAGRQTRNVEISQQILLSSTEP